MKKVITIGESIDKIKFMMKYDSNRTVLENEDSIDGDILNEQIVPSNSSWVGNTSTTNMANNPALREIGEPYLNSMVRKLKRNYDRIDGVVKQLEGWTYKGKPAIDAIKSAYQTKYGVPLPSKVVPTTSPTDTTKTVAPTNPTRPVQPTYTYKVSAGTPEDPYVYGSSGSGIKSVQQNLGFRGGDLDGKWGPVTQKAIAAKLPNLKQFTNDELPGIIQKIRGAQPIAKAQTPSQTNLTTSPDTTQLAGQNKSQQNLAYNTNTTANKGV